MIEPDDSITTMENIVQDQTKEPDVAIGLFALVIHFVREQ